MIAGLSNAEHAAQGVGTPTTCPGCGKMAPSFVVDSRSYPDYIRRRRQCTRCGHRWRTYETAAAAPVALDVDKVCRAVTKSMGEHPATPAVTALLRALLRQIARLPESD